MTINTQQTKLFDGIVIFTQVVNCGSFSAAAELTGHSNSYISKEINKLEARLSVRLLNRTTRSLSLTPEGKIYYEQCQLLVSDAEDALSLLNQSAVKPKGKFKISCPIAFAQGYLQSILFEYMKLYPDVQLELELNDRRVDLVQDGFDLVIRATNQLEESSLICRKIYSCKAYTVASSDYLERFGRPSEPAELARHQCLCYSNLKNPYRWHFQSQTQEDIFVDVNCKVLCNSAQMELAMVLSGQGICRLPEFAMEKALKDNSLEVLFTDYPAPDINVYAIYPSRKHLSPKVRCLVDLLTEKMPDL
ncbi:MAG: LysR family transcriptional regulator [Colwellia sp.]|nr:LysR family transcriptional regulator [Colwellia sp.]MCW8865761.1 LysR family transcriptional regulator [Colwellia sp.]MCW9081708.1 LysR family transcriptional regulator [Colwellia sp.]